MGNGETGNTGSRGDTHPCLPLGGMQSKGVGVNDVPVARQSRA